MSEFITIRPATRADAALIMEFIRSLAEYERLTHEVEATPERIEATLFANPPAAHCVLAFGGAVPAGFAIYFHNYSTFLAKPGLYLEDLFVKPAFRGRGIGRALLLHLAGIAREQGCGRMEWAVLDWNTPAIGFYQSIGARFMDDWKVCRLAGASLENFR
ncbi:MAG TPA: GNAT family N-acetyltransferase [Opitutaceae bacterium]